MAEIHPRLKISADQPDQHSLRRPTEDALEPLIGKRRGYSDLLRGWVRRGDGLRPNW